MDRTELVNKAKELLACGALSEAACDAIKADFPELSESEDERIRKKLVEYISDWGKGQLRWNSDKEFCSRALSYLEKQKEQKPAEWDDKDLPQGGESIMINRILHSLRLYREMLKDSDFEKDYIKATINNCLEDEKWLTSLETFQKPADDISEYAKEQLKDAVSSCVDIEHLISAE